MKTIAELITWLKGNAKLQEYRVTEPHRKLIFLKDDSRRVDDRSAFLALKLKSGGDGHKYIGSAVSKGSPLIIFSKPYRKLPEHISYAKVENLAGILPDLLNWFYDGIMTELVKIGITGTNGKTTTTILIENTLNAFDRLSVRIGTVYYSCAGEHFTSNLTTPTLPLVYELAYKGYKVGAKYLIMEVSSHALELERLKGIGFDLVGFTNLTHDHLDFHRTMENYFNSKLKLFLEYDWRIGLFNLDNPYSRRAADIIRDIFTNSRDILGYSLKLESWDGSLIKPTELRLTSEGSRFKLLDTDFETPLIGEFNVENCILALASLMKLGFNLGDISRLWKERPEEIFKLPGRLERIHEKPFIFVDYSHTPDALERALRTLRTIFPNARLHVVFGAGGDRDREKRPVMGKVASILADFVYITSDNPRHEDPRAIIDDILKGVDEHLRFKVIVEVDRRVAIYTAVSSLKEDDVLLIAGKGHENYQQIGDERIPFSDAQVAREAIAKFEGIEVG